MMPQRVLIPPRNAMTAYEGTKVTAPGIISVATMKKNTALRPRAGIRASA